MSNAGVYRIEKALSERTNTYKEFVGYAAKYNPSIQESAEKSKIAEDNYLQGNWSIGQEENFTEDYKVRHFKEQLFTGYDVTEFEKLFEGKPVQWLATTGTDGILEPIEDRLDFEISDQDFQTFIAWYLAFSEKRELLGHTNHLLYICRRLS